MTTLSIKRRPSGQIAPRTAPAPEAAPVEVEPAPAPANTPAPVLPLRYTEITAALARIGRTLANGKQAQCKKRITARAKLLEHWPRLFNLENPMPLEKGIFADLIDDSNARGLGLGINAIKYGFESYCTRPEYHQAVIDNAHRVTFTGDQGSEITAEQKQFAARAIEKANVTALKAKRNALRVELEALKTKYGITD